MADFAVAVVATLVADLLWFAGGRRFGAAMLRLICRVSLSPDSCVGTTRRIYVRWGAPSLIFAKYVPGLAAVATTLAGETRSNRSLRALRRHWRSTVGGGRSGARSDLP